VRAARLHTARTRAASKPASPACAEGTREACLSACGLHCWMRDQEYGWHECGVV
jgi:hypothetical protein